MTIQTRTSLLAAVVTAVVVSVLFGAPEMLTWLVMLIVPFGVIFGSGLIHWITRDFWRN
jgi:hypothetical protein